MKAAPFVCTKQALAHLTDSRGRGTDLGECCLIVPPQAGPSGVRGAARPILCRLPPACLSPHHVPAQGGTGEGEPRTLHPVMYCTALHRNVLHCTVL